MPKNVEFETIKHVEIIKHISISLKLTNKAATWLMGVMQNPLHENFPDNENLEDRLMREAFFVALHETKL